MHCCLLLLAPLYIEPYNLSLLGRFLAMGILAIGIALVWGNAGILPLGQGLFFGLGGYAARDASEARRARSRRNSRLHAVEWTRFAAMAVDARSRAALSSLAAALIVPTAIAGARSRGWCFIGGSAGSTSRSLLRRCVLAATTFIISQQPYTGGFNGLTDFGNAFGFSLADQSTQLGLYWLTVTFLRLHCSGGAVAARNAIRQAASRDSRRREPRRFLGYDPAPYKVVVFAIGGLLAAIGGRAVHAQYRRYLAGHDWRGAIHRNGHLGRYRRARQLDRSGTRNPSRQFCKGQSQ